MRKLMVIAMGLLMASAVGLGACERQEQPIDEEFQQNDQPEPEEPWNGNDDDMEQQRRQQSLARRGQNENRNNDYNNDQQREGMNDRAELDMERMVDQEVRRSISQLLEEAEDRPVDQGAFNEDYVAQRTDEEEYVVYRVRDEVADQDLQHRLEALMEASPDVRQAELNVEVQNGQATISGRVEDRETLATAVALALNTQGVRSVRSQVTVENSMNDNGNNRQQGVRGRRRR